MPTTLLDFQTFLKCEGLVLYSWLFIYDPGAWKYLDMFLVFKDLELFIDICIKESAQMIADWVVNRKAVSYTYLCNFNFSKDEFYELPRQVSKPRPDIPQNLKCGERKTIKKRTIQFILFLYSFDQIMFFPSSPSFFYSFLSRFVFALVQSSPTANDDLCWRFCCCHTKLVHSERLRNFFCILILRFYSITERKRADMILE